jgi:hypothetical protein
MCVPSGWCYLLGPRGRLWIGLAYAGRTAVPTVVKFFGRTPASQRPRRLPAVFRWRDDTRACSGSSEPSGKKVAQCIGSAARGAPFAELLVAEHQVLANDTAGRMYLTGLSIGSLQVARLGGLKKFFFVRHNKISTQETTCTPLRILPLPSDRTFPPQGRRLRRRTHSYSIVH